jgi:hypothetical protein
MAKKKNSKTDYKKLIEEIGQRSQKVSDILEKIDEIDNDDMDSFVIVYLAAMRSKDPDYYNTIYIFSQFIDVEIKERDEEQ